MLKDNTIWMGTGEKPVNLLLKQANRHGLIAGASGTGKTITLKVLAEGFSKQVFLFSWPTLRATSQACVNLAKIPKICKSVSKNLELKALPTKAANAFVGYDRRYRCSCAYHHF